MELMNILNNMVPVSELNKGKGTQIINDLKNTKFKVIIKNNRPEAVLITAEEYDKLTKIKNEYDEMQLEVTALRRLETFNSSTSVMTSQENLMQELGITAEELQSTDVDIQ